MSPSPSVLSFTVHISVRSSIGFRTHEPSLPSRAHSPRRRAHNQSPVDPEKKVTKHGNNRESPVVCSPAHARCGQSATRHTSRPFTAGAAPRQSRNRDSCCHFRAMLFFFFYFAATPFSPPRRHASAAGASSAAAARIRLSTDISCRLFSCPSSSVFSFFLHASSIRIFFFSQIDKV